LEGFPYLIKIDNWLPEVVSLHVEIAHSNLAEISRMVLVHVRSVVVLASGQTSTTGMLAVLAYTTVSSRDMAATVKVVVSLRSLGIYFARSTGDILLAGLRQMGRHCCGMLCCGLSKSRLKSWSQSRVGFLKTKSAA
jgi:hypothetical protein